MESKTSGKRKSLNTFSLAANILKVESHRYQFEFNTEIQEGLERLLIGIRQQDAELCKDLIYKLKKRNKLIRIADRSPGGWFTVREYEEPSLCGSDSEDDKKLKQAEARALRKIKFSQNNPKALSLLLPIMVLKQVLLFSCLLAFCREPVLKGRAYHHGVEEGELILFAKPLPQTSALVVDSRVTSGGLVPTKKTFKDQSSVGTSTSSNNSSHRGILEKPSQQSQKINDKYFTNTSTLFESETIFTNTFYFHEQYFEIQEKDFVTSSINVKGRLTKNISFWKNIGANPKILSTLQEGYKIPFFESPPESFSNNNVSALKNMVFVEEAVSELVSSKRVVQTPFKPWVVSPLSVSTNKSGKKRLILDLRLLNKLIWKQKIRFDDWKIASEYFEKDSFCFKFDLSKGYHHINIFPGHQTFLGFCVKGKYYCFSVLPFGLSSAPYIFTKVLREMVKHWRSHCIKIVMFLDDGWGTNSTKQLCSADAEFVRSSLEQAGFVINYDKSIWEPVQRLEWLGLFWNSEQFSLCIPDRRIQDFKCNLEELFWYFPKVTARKLAQCVGKVISMMPVIGNIARLLTRRCYVIIENRVSWDSVLCLDRSDFCITELNFWRKNIEFLNVKKLGGYSRPDTLVFSDASDIACGSFVVKASNSVFHNNWSEEEKVKSSTFRELRAVYLVLRAYGSRFQNRSIKWFSDSQNCVRIVSAGSTKPDLQEEALGIFHLCLKWNIDLDIQWVPRNCNFVADSISKIRCTDNWGVSDDFFSIYE